MEDRSLIVSVHDVAPPFVEDLSWIFPRLRRLGVERCSLLVVPDFHGTGRIDQNPAWVKRVREWAAEGHEIVLHGFDHRAASEHSHTMGVRSFFFRNVYTASESEFLELSFEEADRRLGLGLEVFGNAGLASRGFVPPAWLINDAGLEALKKRGFDYTNTLKKIIDLKSGQVSHSWAQVYSSRAVWRRRVSVGWNELLWRRNCSAQTVRISIHPPERRYPMLWNHLESLISRALEGRKTLTYVDFVDQQRRRSR